VRRYICNYFCVEKKKEKEGVAMRSGWDMEECVQVSANMIVSFSSCGDGNPVFSISLIPGTEVQTTRTT
jgi:hypothetical protein